MSIKVKVQAFGRFLSNMIMPNIGAFITWGLITAFFIPTGWMPNAELAKLVEPILKYLLPILIAYTGGKLVHGERGAVIGAISVTGAIISDPNAVMFLAAMTIGPASAYLLRLFDNAVKGKIKEGFEMLVNNFSLGILGVILAIISLFIAGPIMVKFSAFMAGGVEALVQNKLLPLTSILVEPAKVLFLNNAINHGIFTPLGTMQAQELGQSVYFLIEANPGPGLGLLLAYFFFGRGDAKASSSSAIIIHFFGGIHEIYFPYVLMNPRLLIAMILGGMSGVYTLTLLNAGLASPASPGSIFAVMAVSGGSLFGVLTAVVVSCGVTFAVASLLLLTQKNSGDLENAKNEMQEMKSASKGIKNITKVYVACDAGMGSSAMGAGLLRKKVNDANLNIEVQNIAINDLPHDAQLVITHQDLTPRARKKVPNAQHLSLKNFLDQNFYNQVVADLSPNSEKVKEAQEALPEAEKPSLQAEQIFLNLSASSKEEAIRFAAEKLSALGYCQANYVDAMLAREALTSTYLGMGIAIPHGTNEAKDSVLQTGIVFCQYPNGVDFGEDEKAEIIIGIAAKNNDHLQVIAALSNALDDEEKLAVLKTTNDVNQVLQLLAGKFF